MIDGDDTAYTLQAVPAMTAEQIEQQRQRTLENVRWLEEHCDWRPFGGDW